MLTDRNYKCYEMLNTFFYLVVSIKPCNFALVNLINTIMDRKLYDFEFYTINSNGDWSLYLIKTTTLLGRRSFLHDLKCDGYVYDRARNAYFQTCPAFSFDKPARFAFTVRLHK